MRLLQTERQDIDLERFRGAYADERHVATIVDEPCIVHVDGDANPSIIYIELDEKLPKAVAALRRIHYPTTARTSGLLSTSRTFGYAPKLTVRGDETCHEAKLAVDDPEAHAEIAGLSEIVEHWYRRLNPGMYDQHREIVSAVSPEWRLGDGVFTSGIINRNNKLPYHYDRGNFKDCWSNMLVFKSGCLGGDLTCPEIDLSFRLHDHSLLMFDGQNILHGVTPFRFSRKDGYRFSVVFYSLKQMWRCDTKADTVALAAARRTERERRRFAEA